MATVREPERGPRFPARSRATSRSVCGPSGSGSPAGRAEPVHGPRRTGAEPSERANAADIELDRGALVQAIADLRPVEAPVPVRRDDERASGEGRDPRGRRVHADPVRHDDRPALRVEVDTWPVRALRDHAPGRVPPVPEVRHEAAALPAVARELPHDIAAGVDDRDAHPVGLAKAEADLRCGRVAVADGREDLRHRRPDDGAARELELLRDDERRGGRDEERGDERRRCEPRPHRRARAITGEGRARPGRRAVASS